MRRLGLTAGIVAVALVALAVSLPADAQPTVVAQQGPAVPANCDGLEPSEAESPVPECRDYLFQIHCQFEVDETLWEDWCAASERAGQEVPYCTVEFAAGQSDPALRCRAYLAAENCIGTNTSQADMEEFCEKVAPSAGPDPRPKSCDPGLARTPTEAGNRCWDELVQENCQGWEVGDNSGAEDINEFCDAVAGGAQKPALNPNCDLALAGQDTEAGRQCRDQLYASECDDFRARPEEIERFCQEVAAERQPPPPESEPKDEEEKPRRGSPNVLLQLGREPACDHPEELNEEVQRACALTGSVMHKYPFANYGIDNNAAVTIVDDEFLDGAVQSMFQWLMVGIWQVLLWLLKVALLVVQWAFGVDPLGRSIDPSVNAHPPGSPPPEPHPATPLSDSVMAVFDLVGPGWRLTALAVLGVWAMWTGLIRLRVVETLTGVMLTALAMVAAMWIVYDPEGTVGQIGHFANEGALTMLSATSSGELRSPEQGLAEGQRAIFDQMVVGPWCALQFGGLGACRAATGDPDLTRAELWLSLPANSSARELLYKATKEGPQALEEETDENMLGDFFDAIGDGLCYYSAGLISTCTGSEDISKSQTQEDRENNPEAARQFEETKAAATRLIKQDPGAVTLQSEEGVFTRMGLFVVVVIGLLAAIVFLFSIGIRLLAAGVIVLLLILLAPVMMIVAAFGEEGRGRFTGWLKMLLGAAVAKLVYAVLLGLALVVVGILNDVSLAPVVSFILPEPAFAQDVPPKDSPGAADWLGNWLLVAAFWVVATVQLNRLLNLLAPEPGTEQSNALGAGAALWLGQQMVGQAMHVAWQSATFLPRKLAPRVGGMVRNQRALGKHATEEAIRGRAGDELHDRSIGAHQAEFDAKGAGAERTLADGFSNHYRREIGNIDAELEREGANTAELRERREVALRNLRRHEAREAAARSEMVRQSKGYREPDEAQLRRMRSERERDIANWDADDSTWSSERNRRWAGISDDAWRQASETAAGGDSTAMDDLRARSEAALRRDRTLMERSGDDGPLARGTTREALDEWGTQPTYDNRGHFAGHQRDADFLTRRRKARQTAKRRRRESARDNLWRRRY